MLNDLGNAYVTAGDVSNAIDTLREQWKWNDAVVVGKAWVVLNVIWATCVAAFR